MEDTWRNSVLGLQPSRKNQLFRNADRVIGQAMARFALIGRPGVIFALKYLLRHFVEYSIMIVRVILLRRR